MDTELFDLEYAPSWGGDEPMFLDNEQRYTKMHRLARERYGDLSDKRIVDLGCCRGQLLERFKAYPEVELVGLELSRAEIALAHEHELEPVRFGINRFEGEQMVARLPFDNEEADVVLAGEIIEHIVDTEGFLREIHRVLKPGGAVVLTTPNILSWKTRIRLLLGRYPHALDYRTRYGADFGHVRSFSVDLLVSLLEETGFDELHVEGQRVGPLRAVTSRFGPRLDRFASRHPNASDGMIAFARRPPA